MIDKRGFCLLLKVTFSTQSNFLLKTSKSKLLRKLTILCFCFILFSVLNTLTQQTKLNQSTYNKPKTRGSVGQTWQAADKETLQKDTRRHFFTSTILTFIDYLFSSSRTSLIKKNFQWLCLASFHLAACHPSESSPSSLPPNLTSTSCFWFPIHVKENNILENGNKKKKKIWTMKLSKQYSGRPREMNNPKSRDFSNAEEHWIHLHLVLSSATSWLSIYR